MPGRGTRPILPFHHLLKAVTMELLNGSGRAHIETAAIGDYVQIAIPLQDGNALVGEGYVAFVEPRPEAPWVYVCVLGTPALVVVPIGACRVLERGALLRRVLTT